MSVPMRGTGAERPVGAEKPGKPGGAKGSRHPACSVRQPQRWEERVGQAKPFCIPKRVVRDAYKRVRANHGAAGVDSESLEAFERDLENNLYRVWNRMSSGTYFPPPVRTVGIPKKDGDERTLGIPPVSDRVAQTAAKMYLEPQAEPDFHPDSCGYGPEKSAHDAVGVARQRCWRHSWIIDLDIRGFFDNLDHPLRPYSGHGPRVRTQGIPEPLGRRRADPDGIDPSVGGDEPNPGAEPLRVEDRTRAEALDSRGLRDQ